MVAAKQFTKHSGNRVSCMIAEVEELLEFPEDLDRLYGIRVDENGVVYDLVSGASYMSVATWAEEEVRADEEFEAANNKLYGGWSDED